MGESSKSKEKNKGNRILDTKITMTIEKKLKVRMYRYPTMLFVGLLRNGKIRKIWSSLGIASHPYEAMLKVNIPLCEEKNLTLKNKITPDGSSIEFLAASYSRGIFRIAVLFDKDCPIKLPIKVHYYVVFRRFKIILPGSFLFNSPKRGFNLSIDIPEKWIRRWFLRDPSPLVYVAGTGLDVNGKLAWTSTAAKQIMVKPKKFFKI